MTRGQPLFASDRDHIHHRLLDRSRSPSAAAIQIYAVSLILSVFCVAAAAANHLVVGLAIAGAALMAVFGARVLGYLEWGGWASKWSGREETKILHAAAALARLKIRAAVDQSQLLQGFAIAAREMQCRRIELRRGALTMAWEDVLPNDVAGAFEGGSGEDVAASSVAAYEIPLDDDAKLLLTLAASGSLNDERSQILEELARELGERMK